MMDRRILAILTAVALCAGGAPGGTAFAAPTNGAAGVPAASAALDLVQKAEYLWQGYYYCWYDYGWHGPGWYVCDYGPWVHGLWWGGPFGWHHWRWHGPQFYRGPAFHGAPTFHPPHMGGGFHGGHGGGGHHSK